MKKLVLISSVLFAMVIGFVGCQDLQSNIAGTKWQIKEGVVGFLGTKETIHFDKKDGFKITKKVTILFISDDVTVMEGTYEYENGSGKLYPNYEEDGFYMDFTVSDKILTIEGRGTYSKK